MRDLSLYIYKHIHIFHSFIAYFVASTLHCIILLLLTLLCLRRLQMRSKGESGRPPRGRGEGARSMRATPPRRGTRGCPLRGPWRGRPQCEGHRGRRARGRPRVPGDPGGMALGREGAMYLMSSRVHHQGYIETECETHT